MKKNKSIALVLILAILATCVVGTTLAWLTDTTQEVTNTFTVGNIDIELTETKTAFKMVPGATIEKDPKVTVKANSEACWVFVKVEESANLDDFIEYTVDGAWAELEAGVYYKEVAANAEDQTFSVLAGDKVTVKGAVTKDMMDAITAGTAANPTLTFKAYAIQKEGFTTAAAAWTELTTPAL